MKEAEQKLTWQDIEVKIECPLNSKDCRKGKGIKRYEKRIEHDTVLYIAECKSCGRKAMEWGYDQFVSGNDFSLKLKNML